MQGEAEFLVQPFQDYLPIEMDTCFAMCDTPRRIGFCWGRCFYKGETPLESYHNPMSVATAPWRASLHTHLYISISIGLLLLSFPETYASSRIPQQLRGLTFIEKPAPLVSMRLGVSHNTPINMVKIFLNDFLGGLKAENPRFALEELYLFRLWAVWVPIILV